LIPIWVKKWFSSSMCQDRLLFHGYLGICLRGQSVRGMKLTTDPPIVELYLQSPYASTLRFLPYRSEDRHTEFGEIRSGLASAVTVLHRVMQRMHNERLNSSHDCARFLTPILHRLDSTYSWNTLVSSQCRLQFNNHLSPCHSTLYAAQRRHRHQIRNT
jgi:hypothetical protein